MLLKDCTDFCHTNKVVTGQFAVQKQFALMLKQDKYLNCQSNDWTGQAKSNNLYDLGS